MESVEHVPTQEEKNHILKQYVHTWARVANQESGIPDIIWDAEHEGERLVFIARIIADESWEQVTNTLQFTQPPQWVGIRWNDDSKTVEFYTK